MKHTAFFRSLKHVYYTWFLALVVVPVLVVLVAALTIMNRTFARQTLENITRAQDAVCAQLEMDLEQISIRLSHMTYANNGKLLELASQTDTRERGARYASTQSLNSAISYVTEPVRDIVSVAFYMKDGVETYFKSDLLLESETIRQEMWYQNALAHKNQVVIGSYDTNREELYHGGVKDSLVLVAALAPDVTLDHSEKIDAIAFLQVTGACDTIKSYNAEYSAGKNRIGYTRIVSKDGEVIYESHATSDVFSEAEESSDYIRVASPISIYGANWEIESYIKSSELTADYSTAAFLLLAVIAALLGFHAIFARYFLKQIIQPVQLVSEGLRQVEEGDLSLHLAPAGQCEVRAMTHSFNAMVRRLRALIADYEDQVKRSGRTPADDLEAMICGEMSPAEVAGSSGWLFDGSYALISLFPAYSRDQSDRSEAARQLAASFDTVPRFASRCVLHMASPEQFLIFCQLPSEEEHAQLAQMLTQMQRTAKAVCGLTFCALIGQIQNDPQAFLSQLSLTRAYGFLCRLGGEGAILDLTMEAKRLAQITHLSPEYGKLAAALYIADEKVLDEERECLLTQIQTETLDTARERVLSVICATAKQFTQSDSDFFDLFGQPVNYYEKIDRVGDLRSLQLWIVNYLSWIADYSKNRLNVAQSSAVVRAKHYIMEHYRESSLTLKEVADHVELSEKYFTSRFTKECGETFLSYLTGLRVQKAKELIRTTTFKMYEIAEMVGYNNPEHFNRIFKKATGVSPAQYRKNGGEMI